MKRMLIKRWKPASAALDPDVVFIYYDSTSGFYFVNTVSSKIGYVINHATEITGSLMDFLKNIELRVGYHFLNDETIRNLSGMALSELPLILGATVNSTGRTRGDVFSIILYAHQL